MVAIELTEKHKKKLLKMVKALFPENYGDSEDTYIDSSGVINLWELDSEGLSEGLTSLEIHWFEFCLTHLAEKVINPKDENDSTIRKNFEEFFIHMKSYSWFIQDPGLRESFAKHPIDYLYQQFKKLK